LVFLFILAGRGAPGRGQKPSPALTAPRESLRTPAPSPPLPAEPLHAGVVKRNLSFFDLLTGFGLPPEQIHQITKSAKPVYNFKKIYPGQTYELFGGGNGSLDSLRFSLDAETYIEVASGGETGFQAARKEYPFLLETRQASGIIVHSLFASLSEQKLPQELGVKLVDLFAWDIDFFSEIRKNDYFRVIYEEKTMLDGPQAKKQSRVGRILAAEFNLSGRNHYAFLFNNGDFADYFDADGKSLRKQLLKAPLNYTRISSNFSHRRLHPITRHYAPHLGIDYAAPAGTPVMSTGDGVVLAASYRNTNGNYVKIRHANNYISYYLHLSKFAPGIKNGAKVSQGQVIGYVGTTGRSTGPHLDYRIKKNGKFVNPRRMKLPPARPVSEERMAEFEALKNVQISLLQRIPIKDPRGQYFASGEESETSAPSGAGNIQDHYETYPSPSQ
ncbi:MAG: peptidoglycan DD-metalloendopeptidase family protein, partial [Candidatus Krumholzibacteriota bacterium]|nr:peptidoglycan DD-metalloendopeptidase family protein [Candidatus Krumholzibacteriota bacterium]